MILGFRCVVCRQYVMLPHIAFYETTDGEQPICETCIEQLDAEIRETEAAERERRRPLAATESEA